MKALARAAISSTWFTPIWSWSVRGRVCIFTFHRFNAPASVGEPASKDRLDGILSRLRRDGYRFLGLEQLLPGADRGPGNGGKHVVFTVDDGYADFLAAAEVFLDHGCSATVFLPTAFIDGDDWLWWDKIDYVCRKAGPGRYRPVADGPEVILDDTDESDRAAVARRVSAECTRLAEERKLSFIRSFADAARVALPSSPPARYKPLTWDEIRRLEESGFRFAPHTVTHPVLARVDDEQCSYEISRSWRRLRDELRQPVPILAYPNGERGDYGEREARIAAAEGLRGAVTTTPGHAELPLPAGNGGAAFRTPRFPEPSDPDGACLAASGFYRLRRRSYRRTRA